jgi:hypothetical protein
MYQRTPREVVAEILGSAERNLGIIQVADRKDLVYVDQFGLRRTVFSWFITQRVVAIPYRRFGTTYRYHLQWSRVNLDP